MLVVTYDDGERSATVTFTQDYGFVVSGDKSIIDRLLYEEREPRVVNVPVYALPMREDVPANTTPAAASKCFSCNHAWHEEECTRRVEGLPCGCSTAVA
jgi:hypothetical protein